MVIAHRPALVERADIVFKLDNGRITVVRRGPAAAAKSVPGRLADDLNRLRRRREASR